MLFNSYLFVLLFLPLCLAGYFSLNHFRLYSLGHLFLLGMSLWFYGYFNPRYLWIILASVFFNYTAYRLLDRTSRPLYRRLLLFLALAFNFGALFYFKYHDFFFENVNALFQTAFTLRHLVLPLGISFFTFQQVSFIVDAYRGEVPRYGLLCYMCYVTYFPQLIAGPIVTHDELIPQFYDPEKKRFNWDHFAQGVSLFVLGLSKKVLLADIFGNAANWGFSNIDSLNTPSALLVSLAYTVQIYFDFSGYCDMAVGIGRMMNLDLPMNFDSPYKALTITEFWDRWHMTLTRFFQRYVYIPLGGNRRGAVRTYWNVMVVFLASGLWHGANWTFLLWGALHGVFSVITRHWKPFFERLHPALNWLVTFSFVNTAWVFFRADSIGDALRLLRRMVSMNFDGLPTELLNAFTGTPNRILDEFFGRELYRLLPFFQDAPRRPPDVKLMLPCYFLLAFLLILGPRNACRRLEDFRPTIPRMLGLAVLLTWCVFSFSSISTFLYFNF